LDFVWVRKWSRPKALRALGTSAVKLGPNSAAHALPRQLGMEYGKVGCLLLSHDHLLLLITHLAACAMQFCWKVSSILGQFSSDL